MTIIFDFNRTLFDPETGRLFPGALELLEALRGQGATLHLVSRLEPGRGESLEALGIARFFASADFVAEKEEALTRIVESAEAPVYVVGDHLHGEIRIGNALGAKTIWLKRGRFASLGPLTKRDVPWRTVGDIGEVLGVLRGS